MMKIGVLKKGDQVINVGVDFIAIQRKSGEVDIIPIIRDELVLRIDLENIVTIGYGNNMVQVSNDEFVVTTF